MFIDHAAVYVEDLERGARFYEQYFGGVRGERYENPRTGFSSYFITFDGGNTRLEVMHNDAIARPVDRGARGYAHVAFNVGSRERARFYEQYFGGVRGERYENPRTGFSSYFITFDGGNTRLEVMHNDAIARPVDRGARGYAHVAFNVGSRERVDELTAQLVADGYEKISGPRVTGDGYYESCILDAEGNTVEITG